MYTKTKYSNWLPSVGSFKFVDRGSSAKCGDVIIRTWWTWWWRSEKKQIFAKILAQV